MKQTNSELFHCRKNTGFMQCERILGVLVSSDGTCHEHVNCIASKANWVQGLMKNTFSSWSDEIARIVYPTFVRPNLEFPSSVWNPHIEYDSKHQKVFSAKRPSWKNHYTCLTKTRFDRPENKTRKGRFHSNLKDFSRPRKGKLLQWKQKQTEDIHSSSFVSDISKWA